MGFFNRLFGWGGNSYQDVTQSSVDRTDIYVVAPEDARLPIGEFTRKRIAEKAEAVRQRFGVVQEWGRGIARHTVGTGIAAQFNTDDEDWNDLAMQAVEHYCMTPSQCDLSGRRNVYEQQLWLAEQFAIVGETFSAFIENPAFPSPVAGIGACPSFFNIAANDIQTPDDRKLPIHDGVEFGDYARTAAYWARMFGEKGFQRFAAGDVAHIYDPHSAHGSRGVSPLAPSLNKLIDMDELRRLEIRTAKAHRQVALIIKGVQTKKDRGPFGGQIQAAGTGNGTTGTTGNDTAQMEKLYGHAGAAIARMGEDGSVELLTSNSPNPALSEFFNEVMLSDASLALGISPHFWNPVKLGGANIRGIYAAADATFRSIADRIIYRFFEPLVVRFIRWRVASGLLAEPPGGINGDWADKMTYRRPRRVTVDNGRDSNARCTEVIRGLSTWRDEYDEQGRDWRPAITQRVREIAFMKEEGMEAGLTEDEAKMVIAVSLGLQPQLQPTAQTSTTPATEPADTTEADTEDPKNL